jgi:hypothetical protein
VLRRDQGLVPRLHIRRQSVYSGRDWTGLPEAELGRLWLRLQPLAVDSVPLAESISASGIHDAPAHKAVFGFAVHTKLL